MFRIRTRSYPIFKSYHSLFYKPIVGGGYIKYISDDLINYLTPRVLAFWFMDDGAFAQSGLYLHTEGFTYIDEYKLAGMLHYKFGLNVTVQSHENKPMIYIQAKSVVHFKSLVEKYMRGPAHPFKFI